MEGEVGGFLEELVLLYVVLRGGAAVAQARFLLRLEEVVEQILPCEGSSMFTGSKYTRRLTEGRMGTDGWTHGP